jgi:hypothetical protein
VSRLGGFTRPFSGLLFPLVGAPQPFVFTGEAITSRPRSSPILMGWWSVQRNDYTKVLIATGRARQHHQQCRGYHKERNRRSGSGGFSEYLGAFTHFMNDDVRCGSKPARWRCRVFFTKERIRHGIPEEPGHEHAGVGAPAPQFVKVACYTHP